MLNATPVTEAPTPAANPAAPDLTIPPETKAAPATNSAKAAPADSGLDQILQNAAEAPVEKAAAPAAKEAARPAEVKAKEAPKAPKASPEPSTPSVKAPALEDGLEIAPESLDDEILEIPSTLEETPSSSKSSKLPSGTADAKRPVDFPEVKANSAAPKARPAVETSQKTGTIKQMCNEESGNEAAYIKLISSDEPIKANWDSSQVISLAAVEPVASQSAIVLVAGQMSAYDEAPQALPADGTESAQANPAVPLQGNQQIITDLQIDNPMDQILSRPEANLPSFMPKDEYIIDTHKPGQTRPVEIKTNEISDVPQSTNWQMSIQGEDGTFMFFNTPQGRGTVISSDPVSIYSPRFRAVRQVTDLGTYMQSTRTGDIYRPTEVNIQQHEVPAMNAKQQTQVGTERGRTVMLQANATDVGVMATGTTEIRESRQDAVLPQESNLALKVNTNTGKTQLWLADGMTRANAWTSNEDLHVFIDKTSATAVARNESAPVLYTVTEGDKNAQMKIYKIASKADAKPGETVDFTIFFENAGNIPVGNVVLVDILAARLQIVDDSAESSVDASFSYEANKNGSVTLRWEITQPISPKEKGAVRFRCLVR